MYLLVDICSQHSLLWMCRWSMCRMASGTTHLERTANNSRQQVKSDATVEAITNLSPTVKKLVLRVQGKDFTFNAGQWVDFFVPSVTRVGGFSMCSSPHRLQSQGLMDLAVKFSAQEPAHWVHTQCSPGSRVQVRVGGDFHYDITAHKSHDLLLVAGGVGINPLLSILYTVSEMKQDQGKSPPKVVLLYSAKSEEEFIFKKDIKNLCREDSRLTAQFFLTGSPTNTQTDTDVKCSQGRITDEVLKSVIASCFPHKDNLACFLCGPGRMIDDTERHLLQIGLNSSQIHFEKWW